MHIKDTVNRLRIVVWPQQLFHAVTQQLQLVCLQAACANVVVHLHEAGALLDRVLECPEHTIPATAQKHSCTSVGTACQGVGTVQNMGAVGRTWCDKLSSRGVPPWALLWAPSLPSMWLPQGTAAPSTCTRAKRGSALRRPELLGKRCGVISYHKGAATDPLVFHVPRDGCGSITETGRTRALHSLAPPVPPPNLSLSTALFTCYTLISCLWVTGTRSQHHGSMYSLKVRANLGGKERGAQPAERPQLQSEGGSKGQAGEQEGAMSAPDAPASLEEEDHVSFSAGNPRVEHITGENLDIYHVPSP